MKFSEVVKAVDITVQAGNVPIIEGHAGIGKSQIPKALANLSPKL